MSTQWKPDDSFLSKKGRQTIDSISATLEEFGVSAARDQILTSRDPNMSKVIRKLKRTTYPEGFKGYLLPVFLFKFPPTFCFYQEAEPGAVLPQHSHPVDQIRVVIWGEMIYRRRTLKAGDWMFIPAGVPYSLKAASNPGFGVLYMYG